MKSTKYICNNGWEYILVNKIVTVFKQGKLIKTLQERELHQKIHMGIVRRTNV